MQTYRKYALCVIKENRLLVQEEAGEEYYLLPGGRAEEGEGAVQALCREVKEELGVEIELNTLSFIGEFEDVSPVRDDINIHVDLYRGEIHGEMKPCSEVLKLIWVSSDDDWGKLAPVTRNKILPALLKKGLLT